MMNWIKMTDEQLWGVANPIMDNLMEGSTEINHGKHCRDFTQRMRDIVTPAYLDKVCHHYQQVNGLFTEREAVAIFRRSDSVAFIWKQYYTKAQGEFVAEMVMVEQDGNYLVDHVMVF